MPLPDTTPASRQLAVIFSARTDVGRTRDHNEDNFLVDRRLKLYIVCDGLGGHHGGEIASATAVNVVREHVREHRELLEMFAEESDERREVLDLLRDAVKLANERIHERGRLSQSARSMGTTLSLMLVVGQRGYIAHVGDTRVYRLRGGNFEQLTEDHSLYNEMQRGLQVSAETIQAVGDRIRNQITRAVGVNPTVDVDVFSVPLGARDRFLLASDGLHGPVDDTRIQAYLAEPTLEAIASELIEAANAAGGPDNITAVVLELEEVDDAPGEPGVPPLLREVFAAARSHPFFAPFSDGEVARILDGVERLILAPGELLFASGQALLGTYVVLSGAISAGDSRVPTNPTHETLRRGAVLCEDALLHERPAPYNALGAPGTGAVVAIVPRAIFLSGVVQKPLLLLKVAQTIASLLGRRLDNAVLTAGQASLHVWDPRMKPRPNTRPTERPRVLPEPPSGARGGQQARETMPSMPAIPAIPSLPPAQRRPRSDRPGSDQPRSLTLPAIPSIKSPGMPPPLPPPLPGANGKDES